MKRFTVFMVLAVGLTVFAFFNLNSNLHVFAQTADVNKVPDQYAVRLLKLRLDESGLTNQMIQLQQQYTTIQQTMQHDEGEIASIKKEALEAAKKGEDWDIDLVKMEFIAAPPKDKVKPAPATPAQPPAKK